MSVVPEATFRKISDSRQNKFLTGVGDHPDVVKVFNKANNIFNQLAEDKSFTELRLSSERT